MLLLIVGGSAFAFGYALASMRAQTDMDEAKRTLMRAQEESQAARNTWANIGVLAERAVWGKTS